MTREEAKREIIFAKREVMADSWIDKAYDVAIKALEEPYWIPCSETVDIPDHEILACDKYGEEMFGYLIYEDEQWMCGSDGCVMYNPIAWREKPEPYKEECKE